MISWTTLGSVAVITIDNPPLNASNHAVRAGLLNAVGEITARGDLAGIVLTGAGENFVAGADIKEFGAPLAEPQMPDVIAAFETCAVPVVAAIRGACLGGGYELALGCDYRIAAPGAVIGLPEVSLGVIPGAGGTQKLPRLTGIPKALELILGAVRLSVDKAAALGMIDKVVDGDLIEVAVEMAAAGLPKSRVIDRDVPAAGADDIAAAQAKALRRARNRPAARAAGDLVIKTAKTDIAQGLRDEREVFQAIRTSPEAFALRHVFFAERAAAKFTSADKAMDIRKIAVIGGGTMGAGIAYAMLTSGFQITLIERDQDAVAAAKTRVIDMITEDTNRGFHTQTARDAMLARFTTSDNIAAVHGAELVIEAVFEDMAVKTALIAELAPHLGPDTVLATNTSYLDIDEMAKAAPDPARFVGLHFFSPAHRMKLVEIVRGAQTSDQTIATAFRLAKKLGKQPVLARNAHGFIGNRIYATYRRHAEYALQDGASAEEVDATMTAFGMAMGPFAVADLSGLDIGWRTRKAQGRIPGQRYVDIADRLCEEGRMGRKTGAGYYAYPDGKAVRDPHLDEVVAASRRAAGITPHPMDAQTIQYRLLGTMVVEAARLLDEGIAARASDVDVAMIHGYGFPRWSGGPLYWASQLPEQDFNAMLDLYDRIEGASAPRKMILTQIGNPK